MEWVNRKGKQQKQSPRGVVLKISSLKRLWHRYFPVNYAKFLRTPFLQNTSGRLLLANILRISSTELSNK